MFRIKKRKIQYNNIINLLIIHCTKYPIMFIKQVWQFKTIYNQQSFLFQFNNSSFKSLIPRMN